MRQIRSIAVLGAGQMGAQIAAHAANAGLPVLLLDLDAETAQGGLKRARGLSPDPFFTADGPARIAVGGFDADLERIRGCDWIVEAVVEELEAKRQLLARVDELRGDGAVVSSNTSGIPIASIAAGRSAGLRRHFLGTHFFNPPRYLPLVEVIPTADTDPAVVDRIARFADHRLGKGVVIARDTPGFIANRIATFGVLRILRLLSAGDYTVEEVDALTGPAIGRPASATCRTLDIAGLDILGRVAETLARQLDGERDAFTLPPLVTRMIERGMVGERAGHGFYRKAGERGNRTILALDPVAMDYREQRAAAVPALDAARTIDDLGERIRALFTDGGRAGEFLRATLGPTLVYAAEVAPAVAGSIDDVDRAMRWGFGWELGPFELWDAIGVDTVLEACDVSDPPELARELGGPAAPSPPRRFRTGPLPPAGPGLELLRGPREREAIVRQNPGASLVDLGDGVLAVEFHSKMNTLGGDAVDMLAAGAAEAARNFEALVVGNDAVNFSAGANLMLVLLEAQEENWDEIDRMVRAFQSAVVGLRYADVPVVVAPAGLTLGGGCEIALHGDRVQAAAETYMGQVEVGVGLVPAGGGTKELLARFVDSAPPGTADLLPFVQRAFELIGFGTVSTSADDARRLGLLREVDAVTMNRERVLGDARSRALALAPSYQAPAAGRTVAAGGPDTRAALELGVHLAWRGGRISDHDALIGRKLAHVLAGGDIPHALLVSEQHLLDLEREAFLSLCGEPKTQARMAHTLKTGKTLRN